MTGKSLSNFNNVDINIEKPIIEKKIIEKTILQAENIRKKIMNNNFIKKQSQYV
jgi:hypothetical protein